MVENEYQMADDKKNGSRAKRRARAAERMGDVVSSVIPHDPVHHPSHYQAGGFEVLDIIEAFDLGFATGNAVKYLLRAGRKDPGKLVEDLEPGNCRWATKSEQAKNRRPARRVA